MPKKLESGTLREFATSILIAKLLKIEGGPFGGKHFEQKSHSAEKNLKGGPFGLVRYCMLRRKHFWFSSSGQQVHSSGQQVHFGVFSKFCRTFGRTILVTSGGLKKH